MPQPSRLRQRRGGAQRAAVGAAL